MRSHDWFQKRNLNAIDCKVYPMSQSEDKALQEFLTEQLEKGIYSPQNLRMPHHSSSSSRRMENYALYNITTTSTTVLYGINIHYPLSQTLSQIYMVLTFTQSWTFNGVTTMSASKKAMNMKLPSKCDIDPTNQLSCSLASPTHLPPSRRWWTTFFAPV